MRSVLAIAASFTPVLSVGLWSLSGHADSRNFVLADLPPLPSLSEKVDLDDEQPDKTVVFRLNRTTSLVQLAASLELDQELLAALNNREPEHIFAAESWFVIPFDSRSRASMLVNVDAGSVRASAPIAPPPPVQATAALQRGDSLAKFLRRHNIQETELKQLNPGLNLSDITLGREFRVARAAGSRNLLAIRPIDASASWPKLPSLGDEGEGSSAPSISKYLWPTKGVFTSGFGWRWGRMHKGIDIANNTGTAIHAARAGTVTYAGWMGAYGYMVEISHADGESSRYAHNSRLLVRKGQIVEQGARISLMGSTGRSTGPHLHFEIRQPGGSASNPLSQLPPRQA